MIQIEKNQLPDMTVSGSVDIKDKYTLAENVNNKFRLENLAKDIAEDIEIPFILYDCNDAVYTDSEDVLQILKQKYTAVDGAMLDSMRFQDLNFQNIKISFDKILKNTNKIYSFQDYKFKWKWHVIYRELAKLLYVQRDIINTNIKNTTGERLYNMLVRDFEFVNNNKWINNFEKVKSLDPIHIFASINSNKLGYEKRVLRIKILFRLLNSFSLYIYKLSFHIVDLRDGLDFNGCPAPMIVNIIGARKQEAQNQIWDMFNDVIENSQSAKINFEMLKNWYGLDVGSLTIFLFWIDAKNFLPLDKNTESLLYRYKKLETFPQVYEDYKVLLSKKNTKLYLSLSLIAYDDGKQKLLDTHENQEVSEYLNVVDAINSTSFKLIALRPLNGCSQKYLKTLTENEYYIFDKAYIIKDDSVIIDNNKDISLFNLANVNLNINAIVGKNGTGKSTIVELIFALIHNMSYFKNLNYGIKPLENLNIELIYRSKYIYKIYLSNQELKVFKYDEKNNQYLDCTDSYDIREFCYTIAVNYSQHSFNRLIVGDWIHSLFHKNDSYKTPIVIEPYRKDGNMDVNRQEELVKRRLLSNLLLPEDKDDIKNSPRQLTEFYKAETLKLTFNINKIFYKTENIHQIANKHIYKDLDNNVSIKYTSFKDTYIGVLAMLYTKFNIHLKPIRNFRDDDFGIYTFEDRVHLYILKKLVSIVIRYERYQAYFDIETSTFQNLEEYVNKIYEDKSHICYKLKQALNFLRFDTLVKKVETEQCRTIEELSQKINDIREENVSEKLTINELVPPAFFDVEILQENINFNTLSSGEKQKIYSVNSILYHLNNINSVDEKSIKYGYVNIILDEIELYFHPELQRQYLKHLRHAISKADTNKILAINILFVTHSPFILSDIPATKILFLDRKNDSIEAKSISVEGAKTFGANIHELLINGFFMQNSVGELALEKIKEIVDFYDETMRADDTKISNLKDKYQDKKQQFYFIQQSIGEKYISTIMQNHIEEIEKKLDASNFIAQRIRDLRDELTKLEGITNDKN